MRAGGLPILMPQLTEPAHLDAFLDRCDAFMMIGGDDIRAELFGERTLATVNPMEKIREQSDFALLEKLLTRRLPTLAICLACQELNVHRGGTLYQDLPYDGPQGEVRHATKANDLGHLRHTIRIRSDSRLARLWDGASEVVVNSYHHQAIRDLGRGMEAIAWAPDGVIEAVDLPGHPFFLAVQWHPERMPEDLRQRKLFEELVKNGVNSKRPMGGA